MNKDQIKKQLNTFEDASWVEFHGHKKSGVIAELEKEVMDKDELIYWIAEAVLLFNKILNSEQPND